MRRSKKNVSIAKNDFILVVKNPQIYEGIMGGFFVVILKEKGEFLRVAAVKRFAGEKIDHPCCLSTRALKISTLFSHSFSTLTQPIFLGIL